MVDVATFSAVVMDDSIIPVLVGVLILVVTIGEVPSAVILELNPSVDWPNILVVGSTVLNAVLAAVVNVATFSVATDKVPIAAVVWILGVAIPNVPEV